MRVDGWGFPRRDMAKNPSKFIDACKKSKADTDDMAKQVGAKFAMGSRRVG